MLHYLSAVTFTLFLPVIFLSLTLTYASGRKGGGFFFWAGGGLGLLTALICALLEMNTALLVREYYNLALLIPLILLQLVFLTLIALKKEVKGALYLLLAAFTASYALPDIFLYPRGFLVGMDNIFNSEFALKTLGYISALGVMGFAALFTKKLAYDASGKTLILLLGGVTLICLLGELIAALYILLGRSLIPRYDPLLDALFFFGEFPPKGVCAAALLLLAAAASRFAATLKTPVKGENPALTRKKIAERRNRFRLCILQCSTLALVLFFATGAVALANKGHDTVPAVPVTDTDGVIELSLTLFEDAHLHRYAYETPEGEVRFLVIKKPESGYGVALDACDICGDAGYYERKNQVVCARCDVVMNISTIGLKGGCNPVPIEYEIEDGKLYIKSETLTAEAKRFNSGS